MRSPTLLFLFVLIQLSSHGQRFRPLGEETVVYDIYSTGDSLLLAGTAEGLKYFNGNDWQVYGKTDPLMVQEIRLDRDHRIWLGTKTGLVVMDRKGLVDKHWSKNNSVLASDRIRSIEFVANQVFVGTYGGGVYIADYQNDLDSIAWEIVQGTASWRVGKLFAEAEKVWVGAERIPLAFIDVHSKALKQVISDTLSVTTITQTGESLILGTGHELYRYQLTGNELQSYWRDDHCANIRDLAWFEGNLWVAHLNGLHKVDTASLTSTFYPQKGGRHTRPKDRNWCLSAHREHLWIGSLKYGVWALDASANQFTEFLCDKGPLNVLGQLNNGDFIATLPEGTLFMQHGGNWLEWAQSPHNGMVWHTASQVGDELWLGALDGIYRYDLKGGLVTHAPYRTMVAGAEDATGPYRIRVLNGDTVYWGGWMTGLVQTFKVGEEWQHKKVGKQVLPSNMIWNLLVATPWIYVATDQGMGRYHLYQQTYEPISSRGNVFGMCLWGDELWYGNTDGELALWTPVKGVEHQLTFPERIDDLLPHEKGLLLATGNGLFKWDGEEELMRFDADNGLPSNQVQRLWYSVIYHLVLGTAEGSGALSGREGFEINKQLNISDICLNGDCNSLSDGELALPHGFRDLKINGWVNQWGDPGHLTLRYKLKSDSVWTFSRGPNLELAYYQLPWGDHQIIIESSENEVLFQPLKTIAIHVDKPWYITVPAILSYMVILTGLLYTVRRYTFIEVDKRNQLQLSELKRQKDAEVHQAKLHFFTNLSHELKTPLTLILGPIKRLRNGYKGPHASDLDGIEKNANYLLNLINELLSFRKLEEQVEELSLATIQVSELINRVVSYYKAVCEMREISIKCTAPDDLFASINLGASEKVLHNVIGNAMKYTPNGGEIAIEVQSVGGFIKATITDSGPGIDPLIMPQIFDRFTTHQGNAQQAGTGIGLALAKQLMHAQDGDIQAVASERGARFEIQWQVAEQQNVTDPPQSNAQGKPSILVVEDDSGIQSFIASLLSDQFNVHLTSNGKEALRWLEIHSTEIILTDIMMPEMDGMELCSRLKADPRYRHLPVIMLSARGSLSNEGLQRQANAYISKPFDPEALKLTIENLLTTKRQWQQRWQANMQLKVDAGLHESADQKLLDRLYEYVIKHIDQPKLTADQLAMELGLHRSNLHRKMKEMLDVSPMEYVRNIRLEKAKELLMTTGGNVSEIAYLVGFSDPKYFSKVFKEKYGQSPKMERDSGGKSGG